VQARLDISKHAAHPWRIAEIAPDFELIDAWALPAEGTLEDFARLDEIFSRLDDDDSSGSRASRFLFKLREWLGQLFGWDNELNTLPIPGCRETSLRERLPADLRAAIDDKAGGTPFRPVYRTSDEWAVELSNATVHAILHVGWVPQTDFSYRGQMGVYVKHRGWFGRLYMAAIAPFRHYIVYPALMRRIERAWQAGAEP
jgi:hypothetical protein